MSFGFGFALPAYPLRGGGGNNPFNQDGPTLDLSFAGVVTNLSDPNGYTLNTNFITPQYQIAAQYVVWETGVGLVDKTFSQIITFSRASGATWFNSAGVLQGVDFSASSNTIGTGSKTFTLDATAGVNRYWTAGDTVLISDQANSANNMTGTVTSYTASTQVLVCNITSTGGSGTITSWRVGSTMPRLDYNPSTLAAQGLLIEEARTNLLTYSEQFDNAAWTKTNSSITANATTSPAGTVTADKLVEALDVNLVHQVSQTGVTVVSLGTYTASAFVKADTRTRIRIAFVVGGTSGVIADANLTAGTISAASSFGGGTAVSSSIQAINNGWYRISVVGSGAAGTSGELRLELLDASGNRQYNGDGTSGLFIWGAQLEAGAFPTSYIPTTTTALTRSADVASVNTLSPWFNASAGTLFAEAQSFRPLTDTTRLVALSDNTANNSIRLNAANITNAIVTLNVIEATYALSYTGGAVNKWAIAYATNDANGALNGVTGTTDTTVAVPVVDRMELGRLASGTSGSPLVGYLRRITYYPRRLSNAELQSITA